VQPFASCPFHGKPEMKQSVKNLFCIPFLALAAILSPQPGWCAFRTTVPIPGIRYFGDSQTQEGGIGDALTCVEHKNIIGFHSASAATYMGVKPLSSDGILLKNCPLPSSYQPESGDRCIAARTDFDHSLSDPRIETIVVALGDNFSSARTFTEMLNRIKNTRKRCVWVMPSIKVGENGPTMKSIKAYWSIAETICGDAGIINPSECQRPSCQSDAIHEPAKAADKIDCSVSLSLFLSRKMAST